MTPELEDFFRRLRAIGAGPTTMAAIRDGFPQQRRDPAIAVAAVTGREFDNVGSQRASSSGVLAILRCVDRCWPRTRHANRSETPNVPMARSTQMRRRAGLTSFPKRPLPVLKVARCLRRCCRRACLPWKHMTPSA